MFSTTINAWVSSPYSVKPVRCYDIAGISLVFYETNSYTEVRVVLGQHIIITN